MYPLHQVDLNRTAGASNSSVYVGNCFRFSALETEKIAESMLLKNIHLRDTRPSFLCSMPSLVSHN